MKLLISLRFVSRYCAIILEKNKTYPNYIIEKELEQPNQSNLNTKTTEWFIFCCRESKL